MRMGLFEKRNCFLYKEEFQKIEVSMPISDKDDNIIYDKGDIIEADIDRLMSDFIPLITDRYRTVSPFKALVRFFKYVCPKSMSDPEIDMFINMETFSRDYGIKPLSSSIGLEDYPMKLINTFIVIANVRESFREEEQERKQLEAEKRANVAAIRNKIQRK